MKDKAPSFSKLAFTGGVTSYLGTFLTALFSFFILQVLVHRLPVEMFGLYSLVVATFIFFSLALNWGIPYVVIRFLSEYIETGQWGKVKKLILRGYLLLLPGFVLLMLASGPVYRLLAHWLRSPDLLHYALFILLLSFLRVNVQVSEGALNAFLLRSYVVGWATVMLGVRLFLFCLALRRSADLAFLLSIWCITEFVLLVAYVSRLSFLLIGRRSQGPVSLDRGIFAFGLSGYLNNFLYFFLDTRIDLYVVGHFLSRAMVGWYAFATQLTNILYTFSPSSVLKSVIAPLFTRQYVRTKSLEEQKFLFQMNCKFQAFILFPVFAVSVVLMPSIVSLFFHRDYLASLPAFWVLSGLGLIEVVGGPLSTLIWILKKPDIFIKASGITSAFWIGASWVLTKKWGILGTAAASGCSFILTFIFQRLLLEREVNVKIPWCSLATIALHAALAGFSIFALRNAASSPGRLVVLGITGVGIFLFFSYRKKVFNDEERSLLRRVFPIGAWIF